MFHYIKLKKGWSVRFYHDGKQIYLSGFANKELAAQAAADYQKQNSYAVDRDINLEEFLKLWLSESCHDLQEKTKRRYIEFSKLHVIPIIGELKLSKIQPAHLDSFYKKFKAKKKYVRRKNDKGEIKKIELDQTYSSRTVSHCHRMLHTAFEYACKKGYLQKNPAQHADAPRATKKEIVIPTDQEITKIFDYVQNSIYFLPIYIASTTGMRLAEICGLQNSDIDMQKGRFFVKHTLKRIKGKMELSTTKTHGSQRNIPFLEGNRYVIEEYQKNKRELKMLMRSIWKDNDFVCCNNDGSPILPDALTHAFIKMKRKLNLNPGITFHSLRHYHATWMLRQGVNPKIVAERLGHSKIQILLDTYTHLIPGIQEDAIKNLDTSLFKLEDKRKSKLPVDKK